MTVSSANITVNTVNFNSTSAGSNYTIASATGDILTLAGTLPTINVAAGENPTISAILAGTAGFTYNGNGTGNLALGGVNTYPGTTVVTSGILTVNAGGTLGAATAGLTLGTTAGGSATSVTLNINGNTTVGNFVSNNGALTGVPTNTVNINTGTTLSINGTTTFGVTGLNENNVFQGGGNLAIKGGVFALGVTAVTTTNADLSGLSNFTFSGTGTQYYEVGAAASKVTATLTLANVSNVISADTIYVGGLSASNGGTGNLRLGNGTNVLNANTLYVGQQKTSGNITFLSGNGTVTINGLAGGAATTNIFIGYLTTGTGASTVSSLSLPITRQTYQRGP